MSVSNRHAKSRFDSDLAVSEVIQGSVESFRIRYKDADGLMGQPRKILLLLNQKLLPKGRGCSQEARGIPIHGAGPRGC